MQKINRLNQTKFVTSLQKIIQLVWGAKPAYTLALCVLNIAQGILPAVSLWLGKLIIDSVVRGIGFGQTAFLRTLYLLLALLGIQVISSLASYTSNIIQTLLGDIATNKITTAVIEKSVSLDLVQYENPHFFDMLSRAQREASHKPILILTQMFDLIRNVIALVSLTVILFRLNGMVVIAIFLTSIPYSLVQQKYARKGYSLLFSQTQDSRKLLYFFNILTSITHFKEIKLFNIGNYLMNKYRRIFNKIFLENKQMVIRKNVVFFLSSVLSSGTYIAAYAYIVYLAINQSISLGDLTLYTGVFAQCQSRFGTLFNNISSLYESNLFINNLFEFLGLRPALEPAPMVMRPPSCVKKGIAFRNVSFRYPGSGILALKNISFHIRPNESIALVGDNGAGKSTLVKLLSRLYDPLSGEIYLDGVNIKEYELPKYYELIGIVFQDYAQYYLSARENVGIGNVDYIENMDKIHRAACKSGADKVIAKLPSGYESILGRYFDEGNQLSSGEWQKIAIARAFMRDCGILILDEPTASLDAKTEYKIFNDFKQLVKDRISIVISHRFSTVRMVDKIYVLENGEIIEQGTHEELVRQQKKYAKMFHMQAEKYIS